MMFPPRSQNSSGIFNLIQLNSKDFIGPWGKTYVSEPLRDIGGKLEVWITLPWNLKFTTQAGNNYTLSHKV